MSVELHLPDLPEVPISIGSEASPAGATARPPVPWSVRLREALSTYLPLLLMGALALATWWLVKHTPLAAVPTEPRPPRTEPDYTMREFALERFEADGRLVLRIEGAWLHHFPDTDRVEIQQPRVRAIAADGREMRARAERALANGDGSEVQLLGGAEVVGTGADGQRLTMRSEFLHAFLVTERVRTHLPVALRYGRNELNGAGLEYDNATGRLEVQGPMRALLAPLAPSGRRP